MDIRKFLKRKCDDGPPKKMSRCDVETEEHDPSVERLKTNSSFLNEGANQAGPSTLSHETCGTVSYDVGVFIGNMSKMDDFVKFKILTDPWKPGKDYIFPTSSHLKRNREEKRRVNLGHFEKYEWLVFSEEKKGLFCKYCAIFAHQKLVGGKKTVPLCKLVTEPLQKYAKLTGKDGDLETHAAHVYHQEAETDGKSFLSLYSKPEKNIINSLDESRRNRVLQNRARLTPIIKTILLHGRQNIPLRGHRDDGNMTDFIEDPVANEGNFRALLRFRVDSGDTALKEHLTFSKSNATYISKTTTNELIKCCGDEILEEILRRVSSAKFYSILFDETTDVSHVSQLSISLRYVYSGNPDNSNCSTLREDFIGFVDLYKENYDFTQKAEPNITGEVLGQTVIRTIENMGLNLENCVGIGCDGCSVNISDVKGAASVIKKKAVNSCLCVCKNHSLNLSISKSSKVQSVRNALGTIKEVATFFSRSAKRTHVLYGLLGHQIKSYCETRWTERHESIFDFQIDLPKIADALSSISSWNDSSTATMASCLFHAVTSCEFIVTIHCLSDVLGSTVILSQYLQGENIDVAQADEKIKQVISVLESKRTQCDDMFSIIYEAAKKCMHIMEVEERLPRLTAKQTHRSNFERSASENDYETYWKRTIFIPILDHIVLDIKTRFQDKSLKCFSLYTLMPKSLEEFDNLKELNEKLDPICQEYSSVFDFHGANFKLKLVNEILSLKKSTNYENFKKIDRSIVAFDHCNYKIYPILNSLFKLLSTLPISVATAERSFSSLRRLKNWMRARMTEERLTGLALLHIHQDIRVEIDDVINRFSKTKDRRLNFVL